MVTASMLQMTLETETATLQGLASSGSWATFESHARGLFTSLSNPVASRHSPPRLPSGGRPVSWSPVDQAVVRRR
jgi:hypothetical protein